LGLAFGWTDAFGQPRLRAQSHWEVTERFAEVTGPKYKHAKDDFLFLTTSKWVVREYRQGEHTMVMALPKHQSFAGLQEVYVHARLQELFKCSNDEIVWLDGSHGRKEYDGCFACDPSSKFCESKEEDRPLVSNMRAMRHSGLGKVVDYREAVLEAHHGEDEAKSLRDWMESRKVDKDSLDDKETQEYHSRHKWIVEWIKYEAFGHEDGKNGKRCFVFKPCHSGSTHLREYITVAMSKAEFTFVQEDPLPLLSTHAEVWRPQDDPHLKCPFNVRVVAPEDVPFKDVAKAGIQAAVALSAAIDVQDWDPHKDNSPLHTTFLFVVPFNFPEKALQDAETRWQFYPMLDEKVKLVRLWGVSQAVWEYAAMGKGRVVVLVSDMSLWNMVKFQVQWACQGTSLLGSQDAQLHGHIPTDLQGTATGIMPMETFPLAEFLGHKKTHGKKTSKGHPSHPKGNVKH
jgi:hypothetical protein